MDIGMEELVKAFTSDREYRALQRRLPLNPAQRIRNCVNMHSAHTPKPEIMFRKLIRDGVVEVIRRRGKPPLVRRITA